MTRVLGQLQSGRPQRIADTLTTLCALAPDPLGLATCTAFAAAGGLPLVAALVVAEDPVLLPLRGKAVNALGALAAVPSIAAALLGGWGDAGDLADAAAAELPPAAAARVLDVALAELAADGDSYGPADACYLLAPLARVAPPALLAQRLLPLLPRVEALFVRVGPAYNTGRDRIDTLAVFSLALVASLRTRIAAYAEPSPPTNPPPPLPPSAAWVDAVLVAASAADPRDAAFVQLALTALHAVAAAGGDAGGDASSDARALLRAQRAPARATGLLRKHPRLRPYVALLISALVG